MVTTGAKKARSPSYPAIGLADALERAKELHTAERRNPAPVGTILGHWGYKPGSGSGVLAIAALRKFGLLEYTGTGQHRQGRLTDLALRIILDEREDSPERQQAIYQAALMPTIHSEIRRKFPEELPSDGTLKHYLEYERKFTPSAAELLIDEVRGTWAFAGLAQTANVTVDDETHDPYEGTPEIVSTPSHGLRSAMTGPTATAQPAGVRSLRFPLPGGGAGALEVTRPLTEEEWATFTTVLTAMKASFVEAPLVAVQQPE